MTSLELTEWLSPLTESRRAHSLAVGRKVENAAPTLPEPARQIAVEAAYLHDVGYGHPVLGFHPIDGANFLLSQGRPAAVCHLVAYHTASVVEAEVRGIDMVVFDAFRPPSDLPGLAQATDLLWWGRHHHRPQRRAFHHRRTSRGNPEPLPPGNSRTHRHRALRTTPTGGRSPSLRIEVGLRVPTASRFDPDTASAAKAAAIGRYESA
ncbi:HD domain-containing protein [Nocardia blacklockiae]|nr:HD domain-containing protein [Nocardia blacklockiae]